ncbi:MAG: hypothetical protein EXR79_14635 [Myxococcales bacterium]|nr:hypothetical protein [Myxococcales bacterium]
MPTHLPSAVAAPPTGADLVGIHHCDSPREPYGATWGEREGALSGISCAVSSDTGYKDGKAFAIQVVTVDGKKVEIHTANAYMVMAKAAAAAGINLSIVSGFRTMAEQTYFYNCYVKCNCNNCNLAAKPGYSNHQSGHALDLNTSASGVFSWLTKNGGKYGFSKTVPSEDWHWEWWGGGPGGATCAVGCVGSCDDKNVCTDDSCGGGKCVHANNSIVCWDGDACTAGEKCSAGKCFGGKQKDCNDSNPCTADGCASGTCTHGAQAGACSDGNACTTGDQCAGGACSGKPLACDDGLPCTADACKNGTCTHSGPVQTPGKACSGGSVVAVDACGAASFVAACPAAAVCVAGACIALPPSDAGASAPDVGGASADSTDTADTADTADAAESPDAGADTVASTGDGTAELAESTASDAASGDVDADREAGAANPGDVGASLDAGPSETATSGRPGGDSVAGSGRVDVRALDASGSNRAPATAFLAAPATAAGCDANANSRGRSLPGTTLAWLVVALLAAVRFARRRVRD